MGSSLSREIVNIDHVGVLLSTAVRDCLLSIQATTLVINFKCCSIARILPITIVSKALVIRLILMNSVGVKVKVLRLLCPGQAHSDTSSWSLWREGCQLYWMVHVTFTR